MKINITKKQYRDLLLAVLIGTYIRGGVDDQEGKDFTKSEEIEKYLLTLAKDFDAEDMVEEFHGSLLPSDTLQEEYHEHYIEEYEEEHFWHELTTRLGQRDFEANATDEEKKKVEENNGWLGDVIEPYYKKYEDEFEKHGIERLFLMDMKIKDEKKKK